MSVLKSDLEICDLCFVLCSFADGVEPFRFFLKGRRFWSFLLQSDFVLGLFLLLVTCLSLVFDFFYIFFISIGYYVCVVNALIKGEIEDPVCPRTGGWSLPGVMSD